MQPFSFYSLPFSLLLLIHCSGIISDLSVILWYVIRDLFVILWYVIGDLLYFDTLLWRINHLTYRVCWNQLLSVFSLHCWRSTTKLLSDFVNLRQIMTSLRVMVPLARRHSMTASKKQTRLVYWFHRSQVVTEKGLILLSRKPLW